MLNTIIHIIPMGTNLMIKHTSILIALIFMINSLGVLSAQEIDDNEQEKMFISFSQPEIVEENQYLSIKIRETEKLLMRPNTPMLPVYTKTLTYPIGTKINNIQCTPVDIQEQKISKNINYAPEPVLLGQKNTQKQNENNEIINDPYPDSWFKYDIGYGLNNGEQCTILKIQIYPVRYYQSENTIKTISNLEIKIDYETPNQPLLNSEENYKFVIITVSEYKDELETLVLHKENMNITTKLVTLEEIYNNVYFPFEGRDKAEKIKYFIKNAYDNWGINYVMLVGGSEDFPTRKTHIRVSTDESEDTEIFVSDLYYADLYDGNGNFSSWDTNNNSVFAEINWDISNDELDLYPDVYLGRLACVNKEEVNTCINKIIQYETEKAYTKDWFNRIVVIGGDTVPSYLGDDTGIDEGEYVNQEILDIMNGFIPTKIWDSNRRLSGVSPSGVDNINNAISNGCGFVDFSGHGGSKVWTTFPHNGSRQNLPSPWGSYYNYHIQEVTNNNELPIVINGGCSLAKYNVNPKCFAWSFLSNPNGGGIASFGCTGLGYVYNGKWATLGLVENMALKIFENYQKGVKTIGETWTGAINDYITTDMIDADYKTITEWQLFGDPTLTIAKESIKPEKPILKGPRSGIIGNKYTFNVSTTDPDGDELKYLFDWGDENFSEWLGPYESGETCQAEYIWEKEGEYQIRVRAKDKYGVQSEWSDPFNINLPKNKISNPLLYFFNFLEKHPNIFPILRYILKI
jgi:hypothetical protein